MDRTQVNCLEFETAGFTVMKSAVASEQIDQLTVLVESARGGKTAAGLRNLLVRSPEIRSFAQSGSIFKMAQQLLGGKPIPVRAILFDKTPASNWYVTWHQDLSIPVKERFECEGYGPWSVKDDVVHVQPPAAILEKIVSLPIHLDPCSEKNGPIMIARFQTELSNIPRKYNGSKLHGSFKRQNLNSMFSQLNKKRSRN